MDTKPILILDSSSDSDDVDLRLVSGQEEKPLATVLFDSNDTQLLLQTLDHALANEDLRPEALAGIAVIQGTPRFTVTRLVAVIANTMSWCAGIPLVSFTEPPTVQQLHAELQQNSVSAITPEYAQDPTIN
ncbi:MAG: hypothetical protein ABIG66_01615 [Candidatus Kerfeldbacteria bacterium]